MTGGSLKRATFRATVSRAPICVEDLHHGTDARVALTGKCFVQAMAPELRLLGNCGHAHGPYDVANRLDEQLRIVFFERCLQVLDDRLVIANDLGTVPRGFSTTRARALTLPALIAGAGWAGSSRARRLFSMTGALQAERQAS